MGSLLLADQAQEIVKGDAHQLLPRDGSSCGEAVGHALKAAIAIELPEPVAGVLLEFLEQQADNVLLLTNFRFGDQMLDEVSGVADADQGHYECVKD